MDSEDTESPFLKSFWEAIDTADEALAADRKKVACSEFLEAVSAEEYWSYDGSFTTPPCTEGIKWSVIKKPMPISAAQLI